MMLSDKYCPSCQNAKDHKSQDNEVCWSCAAMGGIGNYKQKKTHADLFRAMSDEELADVFDKMTSRDACCPPGFEAHGCQATCKQCWLVYLRQEATDGRICP